MIQQAISDPSAPPLATEKFQPMNSPTSTPAVAPNPISIERRTRRSAVTPVPIAAATAARNGYSWPRTSAQKA